MSVSKLSGMIFVLLIAFMFASCGDKKETAKVDEKTTENKTAGTNTDKDKKPQTENQNTEKKDTSMTNTETAGKQEPGKTADGNYVIMETTMGKIKIKLFTDKAPVTTANFKKLVNQGFYNGIIFHRVIDGFMIQGGDPTGTGTGGSKETIQDEFGPGLKHSKAGMLSMANRGPNTGTSQFFITLAATPWLDGKHAIFGEVVEGMDVVNKIGKVKTGPNDKPVTEVKIVKATVSDK